MDDDKRIAALLDLAKQHMQRCHELEDIAWRIKFSVWAFFGGLAYLWANGHVTSPAWVRWRLTVLLFPLSVAFLHVATAIWFGFRLTEEARHRDNYRRRILQLLELGNDSYPDRGFRFRNLL